MSSKFLLDEKLTFKCWDGEIILRPSTLFWNFTNGTIFSVCKQVEVAMTKKDFMVQLAALFYFVPIPDLNQLGHYNLHYWAEGNSLWRSVIKGSFLGDITHLKYEQSPLCFKRKTKNKTHLYVGVLEKKNLFFEDETLTISLLLYHYQVSYTKNFPHKIIIKNTSIYQPSEWNYDFFEKKIDELNPFILDPITLKKECLKAEKETEIDKLEYSFLVDKCYSSCKIITPPHQKLLLKVIQIHLTKESKKVFEKCHLEFK